MSQSTPKPQNAPSDLKAVKDKVFARLANLECVSGVGIANSKLAVYTTRPLEQDETRHIKDLVSSEAPGQEVAFVTTGTFEKQ
jgi:hypothetical protein